MKIDKQRIAAIKKLINDSKNDNLKSFILPPYEEELKSILENNLINLFSLAKKYNIRYLYLGRGEICGCENKRCERGWPAMWKIAEELGMGESVGNHDQYQTYGCEHYFPINAFGGWDLVENRLLNDNETNKLKFHQVVTESW